MFYLKKNLLKIDKATTIFSFLFLYPIALLAQNKHAACLNFSGKNNHIIIVNDPKIAIDSGTIEIWMKTNDISNIEWHSIVTKTLAFQITLHNYRIAAYDWKNKLIYSYGPPLNDDKWHHLALAFRNNVALGSQLFLDGKKIGEPFTNPYLYNGNEMNISGNLYEDQYFKGCLDEFRMWNIPLTEKQINDNYKRELTGMEKGLVIYYKFDDGLPYVNNINVIFAEDETSNNLNGRLVGFVLKDTISNYVTQSVVKPTKPNTIFRYVRKNKTAVFSISLVLVLLISSFYFRNRYLQNRNRKLAKLVDKKTAELQISLAQKDVLLQEVHHRVKNNLQVISSMLQLEIGNNRTLEQQKPLLETARRLYCMSLVHEQLYRVDSFENIDIKNYIETLVTSIHEMSNSTNLQIKFDLRIEPIQMQITQCIPVGLIISEMVSNAIKHAFENIAFPKIMIELSQKNNNDVKLIIKDNGVGFHPNKFQKSNTNVQHKTLGMRLVDVFCRQLNGELHFLTDTGFGIDLTFKKA